MSDLPVLTKWLRERFAIAQSQWSLRRDIQPVMNVLGAYRLGQITSENVDVEGAGAGLSTVTLARADLVPEDRVHYILAADANHNAAAQKAILIGIERGASGLIVGVGSTIPGLFSTSRVTLAYPIYIPAGFRLTASTVDLAAPSRLELRAWRIELLPGESFS